MPFVKGKSGNPKGAPRKEQSFARCFETAVNDLEVELKDEQGNVTKTLKGKQVVAHAYMDLAFNKKYPPAVRQRALDTIVERIDGKAQQNVNVNGEMQTNTPSVMDILNYKNMTKEQKENLSKAFGD